MNFSNLTSKINEYSPFYIFCGEELGIMQLYIKQIAKVNNCEIIRAGSVKDLLNTLDSGNSLISGNFVYLIQDDKEYSGDELLWDRLQNYVLTLKSDIIILQYYNLDKRSKLYKQRSESIYEFGKLKSDQLSKYIIKECGLSESSAIMLADACQCDYLKCLNEANKLKHLSESSGDPIEKCFFEGMDSGLVNCSYDNKIFELVDAILLRKIPESFKLWDIIKSEQGIELAILSLIYKAFRNVLTVQTDNSGKGICERTGLTPFEIKKAMDYKGHYDNDDLLDILRIIQKVEQGIKTGKIDSIYAMDYMFVNLN